MFNLIANAMFEATRTANVTPAPVRKGWFRAVSDNCIEVRRRWTQAATAGKHQDG
ncbi:hypothetical protein [Hoeflea ulvae]|uniref:Uncharacterized protein n=1 Tax=Hoeflea ulvae TaxID=2983764 RepID=A0ABT3YFA0_9HYPH|nr:hypothetical protein [Hoeflea ulvae]MCY0094337.1 hypothetical protein [Hoeflea ulvae]